LDSEFPHGTDQFISAAATNSATMGIGIGRPMNFFDPSLR
jgi:hypothetical protein